jgi:hypothetical protein
VCGSSLVWPGTSGAGSACAFGMMDHLSLKVCAAAGSTCIPIQAGTVAIATILEKRRMVTNKWKSKWTMHIGEAVFLQMEKFPCRQKVNNYQDFPNYDVGRYFRRTATRNTSFGFLRQSSSVQRTAPTHTKMSFPLRPQPSSTSRRMASDRLGSSG